MSPRNPQVLFSVGSVYFNSAYWSQLSFTTDGGSTWYRDTLDSLARANTVAFDPNDAGTVFLGGDSAYSYPSLRVSTDLGTTWTTLRGGLSGAVYSVAAVSGRPGLLYCGTAQGLYKSTDAGASWTRKGTMTTVRAVCVDSLAPQYVYAATGSGVYSSTDGGENWSPFNAGLANTDVLCLALRPGPAGGLFAGTNGGGVFRTSPLTALSAQPAPGRGRVAVTPNPCRGRTELHLNLPAPGPVRGAVYDRSGRLVRALAPGDLSVGTAVLPIDLSGLPDGAYFLRLNMLGAGQSVRIIKAD